MFSLNQKGASLVTILILVVVFGLLIGGSFILINVEKAKARDAKRLSDITRIQAAFEFLYNETASYGQAAIDGCSQAGMLVSQCNLKKYLPTINQFSDPGKYSYVVSQVPNDESFQITFTLEKDYDSFRAGSHTLTPTGIK